MKKLKLLFFILFIILFIAVCALGLFVVLHYTNKKVYYADDFGIKTIKSQIDFDNDGIDDYTDILLGAKAEASRAPTYKSAYYAGGYPPDSEGVCTDVIWRSFRDAGYSLKDMVDEDIKNNVSAYPRVNGKPDTNIDFRRVPNLKVYFERNHIVLTTDLSQIAEWQPGDIVTFGSTHIGIISDKRNENGITYLLHNGGQPIREEDVLEIYNKVEPISGHFRLKGE